MIRDAKLQDKLKYTNFSDIHREIVTFGLRINARESVALCIHPCFLIWRQGALVQPWTTLYKCLLGLNCEF